jgi:hypothetical protein
MLRISQYLATLVLVLAVVSVAIGATFIYQAVEKDSWMQEAMRIEKVTLGLPESAAKDEVVDTAEEAQIAGDAIREHRRNIAATYDELLAGERYDPTNPKHLSYAQALNMENYLYLAVLGFGVATVITVTGVFMILMGVALGGTGVVLFGLARIISQAGQA